MTNPDPHLPNDRDQLPQADAPKRTFSRRILTAVSAGTLAVGLLVGGGAGVALGTTVLSGTSAEQSGAVGTGTPPDFGTGTPPDMGSAPGSGTPPTMDDGTSADDSGSTSSDSTSS